MTTAGCYQGPQVQAAHHRLRLQPLRPRVADHDHDNDDEEEKEEGDGRARAVPFDLPHLQAAGDEEQGQHEEGREEDEGDDEEDAHEEDDDRLGVRILRR